MNLEGVRVCPCLCVSVFDGYISCISVCVMVQPAYNELSAWSRCRFFFFFPDLRPKTFRAGRSLGSVVPNLLGVKDVSECQRKAFSA